MGQTLNDVLSSYRDFNGTFICKKKSNNLKIKIKLNAESIKTKWGKLISRKYFSNQKV